MKVEVPVPEEVWNLKVRPNLADLPTEMLVELSKAKRTGNLQKEADILSKVVEDAEREAVRKKVMEDKNRLFKGGAKNE